MSEPTLPETFDVVLTCTRCDYVNVMSVARPLGADATGVRIDTALVSGLCPRCARLRQSAPRWSAPCPICGLPGGFHDYQIHGRHRPPTHLLKAKGWQKQP